MAPFVEVIREESKTNLETHIERLINKYPGLTIEEIMGKVRRFEQLKKEAAFKKKELTKKKKKIAAKSKKINRNKN